MAAEEPIVLPLGTEVSAKYRGAFCEAKIKKIIKCVKCRVTVKDTNQHLNILDDDIKGPIKAGCKVEVKHPETGQTVEATINKVTDSSTYTVVFDDGDENTLRRTQLCLKGEKHFVKSETLDQLPLTHPEHFGTPVMKSGKGFKRRKEKAGSDSESEEESDSDSPPKKRTYKGRLQDMVGKVVLMETEDRKRTYWVPTLVVSPNANDLELKHNDHLLLKSFKDSKFYAVAKKGLKEFTKDHAAKNDDKTIKAAMDKALTFFEHKDLPTNWDKEELLGSDSESEEDESESSDDEPSEDKDRFVAQLYKFMDDRGTPINKGPTVANRDLSLYRLFRVVQNFGGYNKVTNQMKWRAVYNKMGLPPVSTASNQIKAAYKKYLHAFEDFYRKLGSTMGTISRPGRSRHNSGRSLLPFRERESPKSPRIDKKAVKEEKESVKEESDIDSESPRKGRSGTRGKEEAISTPTTRKAIRDDVSKMVAAKDSKATTNQKDAGKLTPAQKDKAAQKDASRITPSQKDSPAKADKKQDEKKKGDKSKDVKKEKEEEKSKANKDDDTKKKKVIKKDVKKGKDADSVSADGDVSDESEAESTKETGRRESRRQFDMVPEYPAGSRLKIKYGKGKNQKLYEAKVMKAEPEGSSMHYLVHYAGWNVRYDEWITKERIMSVVEMGKPGSVERQTSKSATSATSSAKSSTKSPIAAPIVAARKKSTPAKPATPPPSRAQNQDVKSKLKSPPSRPTRSTSHEVTRTPPAAKRRTRKSSGFGTSQISESESEDLSDEDMSEKMPTVRPRNKDEQRVMRRDDETPSPYSFTKSDIEQLDMEENEETIAAFKAREELLEKESTNSVKDAAMEKLVADVLDDETKSDELGFDIKSSEDEEKMEVNLDIDKFLEEMDEADKEMPMVGELGLQAMDHVKVSDQPSPLSATAQERQETPKKKLEKTPKGKKKETGAGPGRGRKKPAAEPPVEPAAVVVPDNAVTATSPAKTAEKIVTTPVKLEVFEAKKPDSEIKITSPEISKEIKIELEDVKKIEKDDSKKKKGKKDEVVEKIEKEEKKIEKGKGKGKKKKEAEEKEVKEESDSEKRTEKKVETEKKKTKKKVKKKAEESPEKVSSEPNESVATVAENKAKQDDTKLEKSEKTQKPEDSKVEVSTGGESDSVTKPLTNVSSPKQLVPVAASSQEPKEVPGHSPRPNRDVHKPEESSSEPKPHIPETSSQHHQQPSSVHLPNVPSHSGVFDPMALLAHVSSTAQAAATNTVFQNTPPDTPERSPHVLSHGGLSPEQDSSSMRSEGDIGMESETMGDHHGHHHHLSQGGESPTTCDTSTLSNGSSAGSSGNLPSSESGTEAAPATSTAKRKSTAAPDEEEDEDEDADLKPAKKKKRGHKRQSHGTAGQSEKSSKGSHKHHHHHHHSMSDSDEQGASPHHRSDFTSPAKRNTTHSLPPRPRSPRPPKYNFNLEEGSHLEGEERIKFLAEKIGEIRKIYMSLKSEVALIDRKRKRHRRKEKEAAAAAAAQAAVAAVASQSPAHSVEAHS